VTLEVAAELSLNETGSLTRTLKCAGFNTNHEQQQQQQQEFKE